MLLRKDEMLMAVVGRGQGEKLVSLAKSKGATGGTIVPARGTASRGILKLLGLGDTSRDLVLMLLDNELSYSIITEARSNNKITGVAFIFNLKEEKSMESNWKMITVIVNSGYSEDIMDTARKAGATGGTITNARGTGTAEDVKFFGLTLVPEKEMIMILSKKEECEAIVQAISSMDCLNEPGMGIIYTQDVKDFKNLSES